MANQTLAEQVRMARLNFRRVRGQVTSVVNSVRVTVNAYRDRGEARRSERIRRTRQYRLYVPEYVQSEAPPFSQPVVDSTNGPRPTKLVASDVQGRINTVSNLMKNDSEGLGRGRFVDSNLSMEGGSSGLSGGDVTGGMTAGIDGNSSRSGMNHCRKHTRNVSVGNYILEGAASAKSKDEPNAGEVEPVPTYKEKTQGSGDPGGVEKVKTGGKFRTGGRFLVSTAASAGGAVLKGISTATACIKPKTKKRIYSMTREEIMKQNRKMEKKRAKEEKKRAKEEKKRAKEAKKAGKKLAVTDADSFDFYMDKYGSMKRK